jgi:UDP-2,4-diacetamido-2,4,6-trideoxy-beta-L-altropyranose hydrolase
MHKKDIDVRCDGGVSIGMGHIMRCLALANILSDTFDIRFVIQQSTDNVKQTIRSAGFEYTEIPRTNDFHQESTYINEHLRPGCVVILDGYSFQSNYQKAIKENHHVLIAIDDLHAWRQYADIVINHGGNIKADSYIKESYTKLLLGYDYLLLRKEFYDITRRKSIHSIEKVILSFGASDEHNLTLRFASWILEHNPTIKLHILASQINPHFSQLLQFAEHSSRMWIHFDITANQVIEIIQDSELLICPASTISLEGSAVGISILAGTTASNQMNNYETITKSGAALGLGDLIQCSKEDFLQAFDYICHNADALNNQLIAQSNMIDGKSANRILSEIMLVV